MIQPSSYRRRPAIALSVADDRDSARHLKWNVHRAHPCERHGSFIPFSRTNTEREAVGDPRPSLEERFASRAAYVVKVEAAAEALFADRVLLPADAAYVAAAKKCNRF